MTEPRAWHQALAYAVTGRRLSGLGVQSAPDIPALTSELSARRSQGALGQLDATRSDVPAELMVGLGAAQFWTALAQLRRALATDSVRAVVADRPLTAEERRLDQERPPHHGS